MVKDKMVNSHSTESWVNSTQLSKHEATQNFMSSSCMRMHKRAERHQLNPTHIVRMYASRRSCKA